MDVSVAGARRVAATLLGPLLAVVIAAPAAARTPAVAQPPPAATPVPAPPPPGTPGLVPPQGPQAWVVADADTGNIINAADDHAPMRPASISKVLTAIVAAQDLPPNATVPVTTVAEGTEPDKLGMKPGQVWTFTDTLRAMLLVSANDAAVALAERVSGSREAFAAELARAGGALHLVDKPVLRDPAGLDDEFSVVGGNFISAYDLAIIARAALAIPEVREAVALPEYRFTAPDGVVHLLHNFNRGLQLYPGSIGLKTGYTKAASNTYIAAATRGGRTMVAVVLRSPDIYRTAADLLDMGFNTPVGAETRVDHLPPVTLPSAAPAAAPSRPVGQTPATTGVPATTRAVTPAGSSGLLSGTLRQVSAVVAGIVLVAVVVSLVVLRRRAVRRRRAGFGGWATRR